MTRRVCTIWFGEQEVLGLFWAAGPSAGYVTLPIMSSGLDMANQELAIPRDAIVERATYDWQRRAFGFLVSHPSFDEVPDGAIPPDVRLTRIVHQLKAIDDGLSSDAPAIIKPAGATA